MGEDEEGTHERLKAHRRELIDPKISEPHRQDRRRRSAGGPPMKNSVDLLRLLEDRAGDRSHKGR
jgi:hypothetical protein